MASKQDQNNRIDAFLGEHLALLKQDYSFSGYERDLVMLNLGGGRFMDISSVSGADSLSDGRAAVYFDFDDDGDTDIFLRAMHGPAHFLFRNDIGQDKNWLRVSLTGRASGTDAFGAVVRVKTALGILTRMKSGGSGFVSQSDPRLLFGLGDAKKIEWVEVTWPGGRKQRVAGARPGAHLKVVESARQ